MDDLLKYFQNLYYGFRFKRLKVDDAMHIPEMAEDAGNIRLNEKLQVKLDGIWTEVSGEKIIIDELPTDGSEHAVSSGGVYMKIAAERDERISSIADEAMQRNLAFFVAQVYVKRDLRDSVPDEGDTLRKLYNIIISSFSEITVADIAARNASIVKNGDHVFVTDDGDGRWALYKATSAGVNATYIKLSDPDMLNAIMSASQIKASYESNPDTNAFTNALLNKLNAILGTNTGDQDISGIALNASAIITEVTNRQNIISALQADILTINNNEVAARAAADAAEANARGNADTALQNNINANSTNISANATAISNEVTARSTAVSGEATSRAGADTTLQNNINANSTNISANATAISNEVTSRTNADSNLQSQINGFTSVPKASVPEINAGTVDNKYPSPLGLKGSIYQTQDNAKLYVNTTNSGNAYTASLAPAITAYNAGLVLFAKINAGNSGASTLSLNGLAAIAIYRDNTTAVSSGDLVANKMYLLGYDGTNFQIINYLPSQIPTVTTGEKALTITSAGVQKTYDLIDQVVAAAALTAASFSTGTAAVTGFQGQYSYDANYRYDCVATNTWRRAALNGNLIDLYLADIDDSGGAKTSAQLNTAYSTSVVGQRTWGTLYLYEKKTTTLWKKIAIADA